MTTSTTMGDTGEKKSVLYLHVPHGYKRRNPNDVHKAEQASGGFNTKLAVAITKAFGSIQAFYVLVVWMFAWMILASAGIWLFKLDRYPFSFLLFLSNLVQLWALPVLAVGTSVLGRKQEIQSEEQFHDIEIILHSNDQIKQHLDAQDAELLKQSTLLEQHSLRIEELLQSNVPAAQKPGKL